MKTFYSFKVKFSRVRLDKRTQWQDFKKSMLKKPKLVILKVSYYHNNFQWRLRLLDFTLRFTISWIIGFWLECLNGLQDGTFCGKWQKPKTHTQYWDFFIYAMFQWKFSYIKAQNTTINLIKVTDLSISQYFLMS